MVVAHSPAPASGTHRAYGVSDSLGYTRTVSRPCQSSRGAGRGLARNYRSFCLSVRLCPPRRAGVTRAEARRSGALVFRITWTESMPAGGRLLQPLDRDCLVNTVYLHFIANARSIYKDPGHLRAILRDGVRSLLPDLAIAKPENRSPGPSSELSCNPAFEDVRDVRPIRSGKQRRYELDRSSQHSRFSHIRRSLRRFLLPTLGARL